MDKEDCRIRLPIVAVAEDVAHKEGSPLDGVVHGEAVRRKVVLDEVVAVHHIPGPGSHEEHRGQDRTQRQKGKGRVDEKD